MSYETARAQLVQIVEENAAPALKLRASGDRYKHFKSASADRLPSTRGFFLGVESGNVRGPLTSITRRRNAEITINMAYQDIKSVQDLDNLIISDYEQISDALLNVANWDAAASGLRKLSDGGDTILSYEVTDTDEGKLLSIAIPLEYE